MAIDDEVYESVRARVIKYLATHRNAATRCQIVKAVGADQIERLTQEGVIRPVGDLPNHFELMLNRSFRPFRD